MDVSAQVSAPRSSQPGHVGRQIGIRKGRSSEGIEPAHRNRICSMARWEIRVTGSLYTQS